MPPRTTLCPAVRIVCGFTVRTVGQHTLLDDLAGDIITEGKHQMLRVVKVVFVKKTDSKGNVRRMPQALVEFDSWRRVKGAGAADKPAEEVGRIIEAAINR